MKPSEIREPADRVEEVVRRLVVWLYGGKRTPEQVRERIVHGCKNLNLLPVEMDSATAGKSSLVEIIQVRGEAAVTIIDAVIQAIAKEMWRELSVGEVRIIARRLALLHRLPLQAGAPPDEMDPLLCIMIDRAREQARLNGASG